MIIEVHVLNFNLKKIIRQKIRVHSVMNPHDSKSFFSQNLVTFDSNICYLFFAIVLIANARAHVLLLLHTSTAALRVDIFLHKQKGNY